MIEIEQTTGIDPYEPITEEDEGFPDRFILVPLLMVAVAWFFGLFCRESR